MSRDEDQPAVPHLVLERHLLRELPPAEAEALERRLQADEGLRRRLEALARSDEEIRHRYLPARLAERVRARVGIGRAEARRSWGRYWPALAGVAAATALALLVPRSQGPAPQTGLLPSEAPTERTKGLKPALALYRKTAEGSEALADGDVARAGDLIRVGYRAAGRRFGVILSLDGRGRVTLHLPKDGRQAAPLQAADMVLLDHAFELDDAPRWERFYFVTADAPFALGPILEDARQAAGAGPPPVALKLPRPLEQAAFSLEKEVRR